MESRPSLSPMGRTSSLDRSPSNSSSTPRTPSYYKNATAAAAAADASSQSLSSILNNPLQGAKSSPADWLPGWWSSSSSAVAAPEFSPLLARPASGAAGEAAISRSDLQPYLAAISEPYQRFEDVRNHASREESPAGEGEALVACLREVPALYFKEDFALEDGPTFRAACPFSSISENLVLQEKLSQYLDVVELHLVREISLRSDSFFEAQGQLQDLNEKIVEGCRRIRELKEAVRLLDHDLVESARRIHNLSSTRGGLVALQQKLHLILYVNQALSALNLLVASADCAGALDITDDLQNLLDGDELAGLHCFRHLRDHVAAAIDSVNGILLAEFMRTCILEAGKADAVILSKAKNSTSFVANGTDANVKLDEEETSNFRDLLLPVAVGLLRTARLPSVLRIYRDTLTANMKKSIKSAVNELLPVLLARPMESDFTPGECATDVDGGNSSLLSKLKVLPSDSFVHLLGTVYKIVLAHLSRAAEVKKAIEWILSNPDGHYAADSVAAAIAIGASTAEMAQESDEQISLVPFSSQRSIVKLGSSQLKSNDAATFANMSRNFRADVLRENAEAVFAACDAAHGRWAKILMVRSPLHPRLRLQEFLSIYTITQEFIASSEKIGGRLGYSIRGTLQSQAKAFLDFQHEIRMAKIKAVLEHETWVEVDIPDEFQVIVASLFYSEPPISGNLDDSQDARSGAKIDGGHDGFLSANTEAQNAENQVVNLESVEMLRNSGKVETSPASGSAETTRVPSPHGNHNNAKDRGKSAHRMLYCGGVGYHMVNCGLILIKMLSEYMDMNNFLPALSSEVVQRVVEILKFFNTRSCQLVLGANALQVAGLKSITSKHLALTSQVISFMHAIIPEIRRILFLKVPDARKALLMMEIDRVAQDYKVHRDEIHNKLVQIMRERLLHHVRGLPQIVESWNRPEEADAQPSAFALSLTKEVGFLQRVLSRTLHEGDVQAIFRQVVIIMHSQISEAFQRLEVDTPQAKDRLLRDVKHVLSCIRSLPTGISDNSGTPNSGKLDEFLVQKFGTEAG